MRSMDLISEPVSTVNQSDAVGYVVERMTDQDIPTRGTHHYVVTHEPNDVASGNHRRLIPQDAGDLARTDKKTMRREVAICRQVFNRHSRQHVILIHAPDDFYQACSRVGHALSEPNDVLRTPTSRDQEGDHWISSRRMATSEARSGAVSIYTCSTQSRFSRSMRSMWD